MVVNAAEGEPGTYKDRALLRADPWPVLEGALVAAVAVGAADVVVALKEGEADGAGTGRAGDRARCGSAGLLGGVGVGVVTGPRQYLLGEETALLEVVDGRPPFPRIAPPYRRGVVELVEHDDDVDSGSGLAAHVEMAGPGHETLAPPALVDNVETLANVPGIVAEGADWFRRVGTERSPGTIVCHRHRRRSPARASARSPSARRSGRRSTRSPAAPPRTDLSSPCSTACRPPRCPPALLDTPLTYEDMAGGRAAGSGRRASSWWARTPT